MKIPVFLKDMLIKQYGEDVANKIENGFEIKRKSSFRVNTIKSSKEEIISKLEALSIEYDTIKWYKDAFIISNEDEENIFSKLIIYDTSFSFGS